MQENRTDSHKTLSKTVFRSLYIF